MEPVRRRTGCWKRELDYWEGVIDDDEIEPQPIIRAAIRWLRANPPPPAQKISVVHGDYRTGNFLYDARGRDPRHPRLGDGASGRSAGGPGLGPEPHLVLGRRRPARRACCRAIEAIAIWERASGLKADPAALHWWELFNCVKGQGIWISSAKAWTDGENREPILIFSAWRMLNTQDRAALELMGRL